VRAVDCVALDYGQTLSAPAPAGAGSPVDPAAVPAVRALAARGVRLILASNTRAGQDRRPELAAAGLSDLFAAVLLSSELGFAKPSCPFFAAVAAAAGCPPGRVLVAGNNLGRDIKPALAHGMRAALVRPAGLRPGEELPPGAALIRHVSDLPALLEAIR
jgi:FMN phosphatase YigB (HAD superfamily)